MFFRKIKDSKSVWRYAISNRTGIEILVYSNLCEVGDNVIYKIGTIDSEEGVEEAAEGFNKNGI